MWQRLSLETTEKPVLSLAIGAMMLVEELSGKRRPPSHGKLVTVLLGASALANLAILPYSAVLLPDSIQEFVWVALSCGLLLQLLILYGCIEVGLRLGPPIGLRAPILFSLLGGERIEESQLRRILGVALGGGAVVGFLALGLSELLQPLLPEPRMPIPEWGPLVGFLASVGAGISEEIMFRFGFMTLFAWAGARLFGRDGSPTPFIWSSNVLAALLFGAAHLPQASYFFDLTSAVVFVVLALNALIGIFCGWLFWRYGIVSAMLAHFSTDVVLKVLAPAVSGTEG
jgi:membrane protease YdiL (CAAX protease family)